MWRKSASEAGVLGKTDENKREADADFPRAFGGRIVARVSLENAGNNNCSCC